MAIPAPMSHHLSRATFVLLPLRKSLPSFQLLIQYSHATMDTQGRDHSGNKPLSAGVKRPDAFWGMIVPSALLGRGGPDHTTGVHSPYSQTNYAEELQGRQSMARGEKARPETTTRAQPSHPYISVTASLERIQSLDSDKRTDDGRLSEGNVVASNAALQKVDNDEKCSGGSDDTEESYGDADYEEDDSENETDSESSGLGTPKSQTPHHTSPKRITRVRGSMRELKLIRPTAPKRKMAPCLPTHANGKRLRKRNKFAVEESEGDFEGGGDGDEDEDE